MLAEMAINQRRLRRAATASAMAMTAVDRRSTSRRSCVDGALRIWRKAETVISHQLYRDTHEPVPPNACLMLEP